MQLPILKGMFNFRLATTSYIIPADILPNVHYLGPHFDEVELVLFESGQDDNMPTHGQINEMTRVANDFELSYNVHLPGDLFFGDPNPVLRKKFRETTLRFYERTLPLEPSLYILHLDSRRADGTKEPDHGAWIERLGESMAIMIGEGLRADHVAVENLEYPLEWILPLVETFGLGLCLDIGHLIRYGYPLIAQVEQFLSRSSMVHLHGVKNGTDHLGLHWISDGDWRLICQSLRGYEGGVSIEVFSMDELAPSVQRIQDILEEDKGHEAQCGLAADTTG